MRRASLLLVTFLALPGGASATQHTDYAALRDSLARVTDMAALQQRLEGRLAANASGQAAMARGLAALRLFDLTGDKAVAAGARDAFELAKRLDPGSAWAAWGIGRSLVAMDRAQGEPAIVTGRAFARALGLDPASKARSAFLGALALDPDFVPAAEALAPLAIEARNGDALRIARDALQHVTRHLLARPATWLALASVQRALGDFPAAADAAALAIAASRPGDDTLAGSVPLAQVYRELAIARFLNDDVAAGARSWFDAIAGLTTEGGGAFFEDVRVLTDDWDRQRFQNADLQARRDWLRDFWTLRAATAGVDVADRIAEHYRRLEHAAAWYPRLRQFGAPPRNALLLERPDLPFDDRGIIYIRHGAPFHVIRTPDAFRVQTESWVFRMPDGEFRMVHFANYGSAEREVAVAGDPTVTGSNGALGDAYNEFVLVYNLPCFGGFVGDRILYDRSLSALSRCDAMDVRSVSAVVRRAAREALRTDSDAPDFTRDLPFFYDLHTFRGPDGFTDLAAAIIVPGRSLDPAATAGGVTYGITLSLIVIDTLFERVTRVDTTLWLPTDHVLGDNEWLRAHVTLPVSPSTESIQRLIVREAGDPAHGQLYGRPIALPDYAGRGLRLSDIVLADADSGGSWSRGGVSLSFVPTRVFPGGAFRTFHEVYGLAAASPYSTELTVERAGGGVGRAISRLFGGGGPAVRLRFENIAQPAADGVVRDLRHVETDLDPGRYSIRIEITNFSTGESARQEREFTVVSGPPDTRPPGR
jgi:hypothetical protein